MDLSDSIIPKSDQLNAEDLLSGPRTVTIEKVTAGNAEQPVWIHLVEFPGRPFKPSKTVRRILVSAWGRESSAYTGRRMTLYCDPTVRFGGIEVGGIRVSHMSGLEAPLHLALTVTRGKRAPYVVQPLPDATPTTRPSASNEPTAAQVAASTDLDELRGMWKSAGVERRAQIATRMTELREPDPEPEEVEAKQTEIRDLAAELRQLSEDAAPAPRVTSPRTGKASRDDRARIMQLFIGLRVAVDKRATYMSGVVGHPVSATDDLSPADAALVIEALEGMTDPVDAAAQVNEGSIDVSSEPED